MLHELSAAHPDDAAGHDHVHVSGAGTVDQRGVGVVQREQGGPVQGNQYKVRQEPGTQRPGVFKAQGLGSSAGGGAHNVAGWEKTAVMIYGFLAYGKQAHLVEQAQGIAAGRPVRAETIADLCTRDVPDGRHALSGLGIASGTIGDARASAGHERNVFL